MIDLYTWHTPNGRKVSIMLEEIGMTYNVFPINIAKDEQFQPHFLEVSPNNRIPAITVAQIRSIVRRRSTHVRIKNHIQNYHNSNKLNQIRTNKKQ